MPVETTGHAEKNGGDNGLQRELVEVGNPFSTTVQITFEASRRSLDHAHEGDQLLQSWLLNLKSLSAISLKYSLLVKSGRLLPNHFGLMEGVDHRFRLVRVHIISLDHCHGNHIRDN